MRIRPMILEDADFMLELKNYPETRQFSISTPHEIKREDHLTWLEKNIEHFQVIEEFNNVPIKIAAVRFVDNEVSVWVHQKYRGMGYAVSAINGVKKDGCIAKIVIRNIPSIRAFIKAGFKPIELVEGVMKTYYIFEYKAERWGKE